MFPDPWVYGNGQAYEELEEDEENGEENREKREQRNVKEKEDVP